MSDLQPVSDAQPAPELGADPIVIDEAPDRTVTLEPAAGRLLKTLREPSRLRRLVAGRRARAEYELIGELSRNGLPLPRPLDCGSAGGAWELRFELAPAAPLGLWLRRREAAGVAAPERAAVLGAAGALVARLQSGSIAWPTLSVDSLGVTAGAEAGAAADRLVLLSWHGVDAQAGAPNVERRTAELAGIFGPLRALATTAELATFTDAYLDALDPATRAALGDGWTRTLRSAGREAARTQLEARLGAEWPALPDFTLERSPHATTLRRADLPGDYPKAVQRALDDRPRRSFHSPTGLSAQGAGNAIELSVDADGPQRVLILAGLAWDRTRARFFEALALERLGVATTRPLVLRSGQTPWASFALPAGYVDLALALAESDADVRRAVPRALGRLLAGLHDRGSTLTTFRPRDIFVCTERGDALFGPALPTRPFDPDRETSDEDRFGTLVGFLTAAEKTVTLGETRRFLAAYRAARRAAEQA